jgi:hypothetical protein
MVLVLTSLCRGDGGDAADACGFQIRNLTWLGWDIDITVINIMEVQ